MAQALTPVEPAVKTNNRQTIGVQSVDSQRCSDLSRRSSSPTDVVHVLSTPKSERGKATADHAGTRRRSRTRGRQADDQAANPNLYRATGYLIENNLGQ
jgi:hypothetical protein